jgi:hypothetical protein
MNHVKHLQEVIDIDVLVLGIQIRYPGTWNWNWNKKYEMPLIRMDYGSLLIRAHLRPPCRLSRLLVEYSA